MNRILLFNDFGWRGPYLGQMHAALAAEAPGVPVIDLQSDAPACDPLRSAYLLAALVGQDAPGSVWVCVVDPGVGGQRDPLMAEVGGRWFVGPDNGLMTLALKKVAESSETVPRTWRIDWRPRRLSASFHGRDLFAPVAARLARGEKVSSTERAPLTLEGWNRDPDTEEIIYIDGFGNAVTGIRGDRADSTRRLAVAGASLAHARTFSGTAPNAPFWYVNSFGLVEVAVNGGRADRTLGLELGTPVTFAWSG